MKALVAYVIWNKHDMINWLCEGILKSFKPDDVDLLFLLDDPIDGTDQLFEDYVPTVLKDYKHEVRIFNKKSFKFELQNIALEYGLNNGYEWVICPQDDQKIEDPFFMQTLRSHLNFPQVGLIGGRDGFNDLTFDNASGSLFSKPTGANYTWLKNGETRQVKYLNDGPLIYHRNVIQKVGYHDLNFKVFMSELDYCKRCSNEHLININLGMSVVHEKFGTLRSNLYYTRYNYSQLDSDYFHKKWGR